MVVCLTGRARTVTAWATIDTPQHLYASLVLQNAARRVYLNKVFRFELRCFKMVVACGRRFMVRLVTIKKDRERIARHRRLRAAASLRRSIFPATCSLRADPVVTDLCVLSAVHQESGGGNLVVYSCRNGRVWGCDPMNLVQRVYFECFASSRGLKKDRRKKKNDVIELQTVLSAVAHGPLLFLACTDNQVFHLHGVLREVMPVYRSDSLTQQYLLPCKYRLQSRTRK